MFFALPSIKEMNLTALSSVVVKLPSLSITTAAPDVLPTNPASSDNNVPMLSAKHLALLQSPSEYTLYQIELLPLMAKALFSLLLAHTTAG